ncbi:hypothetical protein PoB_007100000 [Plakobranchus ocellatus]|uniref:Uncharacterized protein n=1 Tax=Plakobranchus ocellatus TaxID=259542 RepID=A0AAV4DKI6_9GAST|nr:hypothetical protein PoB_007100000 [Plakobranchus ocellatus]
MNTKSIDISITIGNENRSEPKPVSINALTKSPPQKRRARSPRPLELIELKKQANKQGPNSIKHASSFSYLGPELQINIIFTVAVTMIDLTANPGNGLCVSNAYNIAFQAARTSYWVVSV